MPKKIYDILPPKVAHKLENTIKELERSEPVKKTASRSRRKKPVKRFPLKPIFAGAGAVLALLAAYLYFELPRATVTITPKTQPVTLSENITADKTASAVDAANKIIPAQYMEISQDGQAQFPATQSAGGGSAASGTIKVYNKVSPATSITLKAGTHFQSKDGQNFVAPARIVVPAMQGSAPGVAVVSVQAESAGSAGNIGPTTFSIPKLAGTQYYSNVWGESTSAMTGGTDGKTKKVSADDLQNAKDSLSKQLLQKAQDALKAKLTGTQVLLDGASSGTVTSASASAKAGDVADQFTETESVTLAALVVDSNDIDQVLKSDINGQLSGNQKLLDHGFSVDSSVSSADVKGGIAIISCAASGSTYVSLDTGALATTLGSKNESQVKDAVASFYQGNASDVKVTFWPFWVHKTPSNKSHIHVQLQLPS